MKMTKKERELYDNLIEMLNGQVVARYDEPSLCSMAQVLGMAIGAIKTRVEIDVLGKITKKTLETE